MANIRAFAVLVLTALVCFAAHGVRADDSAVEIATSDDALVVRWPTSASQRGRLTFNRARDMPLISAIELLADGESSTTIARDLNPVTLLTVGIRDLQNPGGWVAFFDNPPLRPHESFLVKLTDRVSKITNSGSRATVSFGPANAGNFRGDVQFTFFSRSPLIQMETVVSTDEDGRAIVYDTGLSFAKPERRAFAWFDTNGNFQRVTTDPSADNAPSAATSLVVQGRALVAENAAGSLAIFPPPHQFFYPQDEAFNSKFVWHGAGYRSLVNDQAFGVRQSLTGDKRFVPWFNAPPNTQQRLCVFLLVSRAGARQTLDDVAENTHHDRFKPLPGYQTFTSHYHIEHTRELLEKQQALETEGIPPDLEKPGFVETFKQRGVNIAHLAEFHYENGAKLPDAERLQKLKTLHDECQRLSDDQLLVLPGEEPNVHLGGHWISLFPKPVYWLLNRPAETPWVASDSRFGKVYHLGDATDVLKLMESEQGLMWTAHPRIKSSLGFPDKYRERAFFHSDRFLGATWKAMPADLSRPTLGWRGLDLLDDMSNWGAKKQTLGEVDIFRLEPEFESYGHMNINYLQLDRLPRFSDGWLPVLEALRAGKFFVTTGEVLISEFSVGGKSSGETLAIASDSQQEMTARLEWTFPLAVAEIVSGDGRQVFRQRIDLATTESFGAQTFHFPLELTGRTWVRFEVWDIAKNGAFTQPVWLSGR